MGNVVSDSEPERNYLQEFEDLKEMVHSLRFKTASLQDTVDRLILMRTDNLTKLFPKLFECLSVMTIVQLQSCTTKQDMAGLTKYTYGTTKTHYSLAVLRTLARKALDSEEYEFNFLLQNRHKLCKETIELLELYKDEIEDEWERFLSHEL